MFLIVAVTNLKQKLRIAREHARRTTGVYGVQIWLTYDELAVLMNCDPAVARGSAVAIQLDRRKSRDGQTRVKLTPSLAEAFLRGVLQQCLEQDAAAHAFDLWAVHDRMARLSVAPPQLSSVIAG